MFTFVAFDLETTGTSPERDQIIEIGAVRFVDAKPTETFQSFVSINTKIPEAAMRVHGITDEMLLGQPNIADVLPLFTDFCGNSLMVAHNANFDIKFISKAGIEHFVPLPQKPILDSLPLVRRAYPEFMNHRLDTLVEKLEINRTNAHRASEDALACGIVFLKSLKTISSRGESLDTKKLLNWCGSNLCFPKIEAKPKQLALL